MVLVPINVLGEEKSLYVDGTLYNQIQNKVIPGVKKKDMDAVFVVDGEEGSGKSVFTMQLAKLLDPSYNNDQCCFDADSFTKAIIRAKKGNCIVYDEAFTGLSSRGSLSEVNRLLVSLMMEMRQKNLFVIIVMPTFFLLDKYVALWRARGLFHIYTRRGKRGYWMYFNKQKKKLLYLMGKKLYSYSQPRSNFLGKFYDQYTIDEKEYRLKKAAAMGKKSRSTRAQVIMAQRNCLIHLISKELKLNNMQMAKTFEEYGFKMDRSSISDVMAAKRKDLLEEEVIQEERDKQKAESGPLGKKLPKKSPF